MKLSKYLIGLLVSIFISIGVCLTVNNLAPNTSYNDMLGVSLLLFSSIALVVFYMSKKATRVDDKNFFIYVIFVNLFVKIFASFIIIVLYASVVKPPSKLYLINFTIVYLIFTIFETYFLSIQAKAK